MNKLLSAVATATAILMSAPAIAADVLAEPVVVEPPPLWYAGLYVGGVWTPDFTGTICDCEWDFTTDGGWALGITVGTRVWDAFRIEAELAGTINEISDVTGDIDPDVLGEESFPGDISAAYLMGNLWYDFYLGSGFTPYIGGGIGAAWVGLDIDDQTADIWELDGSGFAYQLGLGVRYDFAPGFGVDAGYRFRSVPGLEVEDDWDNTIEDIDLTSHIFQVGLTVAF